MRYFQIMNGLRGCYMPDSSWQFKADTRKELKRIIQQEADSLLDAGFKYGLSKRVIARFAAHIWRANSCQIYGECLPYTDDLGKGYPYGLTVIQNTRAEFRANCEE